MAARFIEAESYRQLAISERKNSSFAPGFIQLMVS